jgi:hypothetical protein
MLVCSKEYTFPILFLRVSRFYQVGFEVLTAVSMKHGARCYNPEDSNLQILPNFRYTPEANLNEKLLSVACLQYLAVPGNSNNNSIAVVTLK